MSTTNDQAAPAVREPSPAIAEAARERYRRKGPTGFLKPVRRHVVCARNKTVYDGANKRDAERAFKTWSRISDDIVTHFTDDELIQITQ